MENHPDTEDIQWLDDHLFDVYTVAERLYLNEHYHDESIFLQELGLHQKNSDHQVEGWKILQRIMRGELDFWTPRFEQYVPSQHPFSRNDYTDEERAFLKENYKDELNFLLRHGLSIYKDNDPWAGQDILRGIMDSQRRAEAASKPQGVRKRRGRRRRQVQSGVITAW